jgi:hypothetical protein
MTDPKGRALKPGDIVLVPCRIIQTRPDSVMMASVATDPNAKDGDEGRCICFLHPKMIIRANEGDAVDFRVFEDPPHSILG